MGLRQPVEPVLITLWLIVLIAIAINFSEVVRMFDPVRRSSAVGSVWVQSMFKVKYCHKIFRRADIRATCEAAFRDAASKLGIEIREIGFDEDHVHLVNTLGLHAVHEVAKVLKGTSAKRLLKNFRWMKRAYFWKSGVWSPAYWMDGTSGLDHQIKYVRTQKYSTGGQTRLTTFA